VTGIGEIQAAQNTIARIYDLNSRQLAQEPQHGIYIKNGKKIVR